MVLQIEYKRAHLLIKKIAPNLRKPLFEPLGYRSAAKRANKPAVKPELMASAASTTVAAATEAAPEIQSRPGSRCSSVRGRGCKLWGGTQVQQQGGE